MPTSPPTNFKARLKDTYDAIAVTYSEWTKQHDVFRLSHLDELCTLVPKLRHSSSASPAAMLEVGCGDGSPILTNILERCPGLRATANDISDVQLDLARANLAGYEDRVTYIGGDMMDLTFEDDSLVAVVALYSFIHLPQEEQAEMLGRVARWLEPGGCVLANFVGAENEGVVEERWLQHDKGWVWFSGHGTEKTLDIIEEVGLTVMTSRIVDTVERFVWVIAMKG